MPYFSIQTNVKITDTPTLLASASQMIVSILGKPESYVMVQISDECDLYFAASSAPLAYLTLSSLGLSNTQTREISSQLCAWVEEMLGIDPARIYIAFNAPERAMWGWNRSTF